MASQATGSPEKPRSGPSEQLVASFRYGVNEDRLRRMLDTFLQRYRDTAGKETIELALSCCTEASNWYRKMLETPLSLDIESISATLAKDLCLCCLVACSLEIAIVSKSFPCDVLTLLKIFSLHPYHFWKVIEPVLRAMELPQPMFTRLAQVETQIIKSLAWTTDSPLWKELETNGGHLPPCDQVMRSSQLEEPKKSHVHPDINTVFADHNYSLEQYLPSVTNRAPKNNAPQRFAHKMKLPSQLEEPKNDVHPEVHIALADHNYSVEQYLPSVTKRLPRNISLQVFARKVYTLMGDRLHKLCRMLKISDELRLKIWTCFMHSLVHCTDLMADRHLDQLLLCAIKIIAELYNREIPFEDMISCDCSQPMAKENVCRSVLPSRKDGENQSHGSNILTPSTPSSHDFYKHVYAIKMEAFAKKFEPVPGVDTPPLTPYPQRWKSALRKQRLRGTDTIYVSPYYEYTPPPRSPLVSYTVNSSTRECLKEINKMLKRYTRPEEAGEDGPPVKVPCLLNSSLTTHTLCQLMGCNTSRGSKVVDPSEKPQERPKTATSTEESTAVEAIDANDKDVEEEQNEGSS